MRVLHVLATLSPSGAERMLEVAAPLASADGFRSALLSTGEAQVGPFAPRLAAAGHDLYHVPFSRSISFLRRLFDFFRAERFDAVNIHCERASIWIAAAARAAGTRRIIRTYHAVFPFDGPLRWRRSAQRAVARGMFGAIGIAHSQSVIDNERRRFANPVRYVPAWIDPAFRPPSPGERDEARRRLGLEDKTLVVACVGSCMALKNHGALLEAVARLAGQGRDVVLLHAGTGSLEEQERASSAALGIAGRVRFLGPIEDVLSVLHAADIFAMPSLREGLGIAALEALASGLPAVFTDTEGLRDLRPLTRAARWGSPDAESIAAGLLELAQMPQEERRALTAEAVLTTQRHHAAAVGWSMLRDIYTSACA